ncbi:MAG: cytidylyltransferase domain-containing protein [Candidatus Methylomirabilales bacterium]
MVLGVIPARGSSKGLPGKNLRPLGGIPLIVHTIRAAQESRLLADYLVSTDDPTIAEVAREAGAKVPFVRPAELASDEIPVWPAIRHAVEHWERYAHHPLEAVAVLQPTSPLRTGGDIDACIARLRELDADFCATVVATHDSPYFNMVEVTPGSAPFVRPCSPLMLNSSRRQNAPQVYALNGAVYVVRRAVVITLENQFQVKRYAIYEMPRARSVDIDGPEDLELAEWLLSREQGDL